MKLRLFSEYETLKAVITHRPGHEIERLTPYNTGELLFEDVPYLEVMQYEHDKFTELIKQTTGALVLRLHDLLVDVLQDEVLRMDVFGEFLKTSGIAHRIPDLLPRYSTSESATILIAGIKVKELKKKYQCVELDQFKDTDYLINPCPNMYFMRDPAAVVQTGVICSNMKFEGRQRESQLIRFILKHHPLFKNDFKMIYPNDEIVGEIPHVEGGDVIVLSKKALAIGCTERTDARAVELVAKQVLKNDDVDRVYEVVLPPKRNFMHLDTVFTIIDENLIVTYPDAMDSILQTNVYQKDSFDENGKVVIHKEVVNDSIVNVLKREIKYLEVIETGDGNPDYSSREQWYDGANIFAISPRRVISYDRNKFTNRALKEAGVEVIETSSSELSRGLGGPHCMTMPIERREFGS